MQVIADIFSLNQTLPMKIAIMLFEQVDLLDFGGPYEVFLTMSRPAVRQGQCEPFAEGARERVRWVDNDRIVTAAGRRSGIDMALHLVHRFAGLVLAQQTARQIDHDWSQSA
jgi:transcriptional regulator GlxA family with amidase domain